MHINNEFLVMVEDFSLSSLSHKGLKEKSIASHKNPFARVSTQLSAQSVNEVANLLKRVIVVTRSIAKSGV